MVRVHQQPLLIFSYLFYCKKSAFPGIRFIERSLHMELTKEEVEFAVESISEEVKVESTERLELSFWWWASQKDKYRFPAALIAMALICNEYSTR